MAETILDKAIIEKIENSNYQFIPKNKFKIALYMDQPLYTTNFHIGDSLYGTPKNCNYILFHPQKWSNCLIIESIWQQTHGTTDEKFPYYVLNIQQKYPSQSIVVIDGEGYRKKALQWFKSQAGTNLLKVFNLLEFSDWVDQGNI